MTTFTCNQKGCLIPKGGACLEGFNLPSECPHSLREVESSEIQVGPHLSPAAETAAFSFHSGEALSYAEGSAILKQGGARIIAIVGAQFSGKTTLLSRIYEEFERGRFAGFSFAGSRTLLELSRRCWLSSCGSMRTRPDTERTKEWETDKLIHFQVQREDLVEDLLIADISGESYKNATSSFDSLRKLKILKRADQVVLFLDCAKLMDVEQRALVESKACAFLRMGLQEGILGCFTSLTLVLSKLDKVGDPVENVESHKYIESVIERVKAVAQTVGVIRTRRIAARRGSSADWISNEDLAGLFSDWFSDSKRIAVGSHVPEVLAGGLRRMQTFQNNNES